MSADATSADLVEAGTAISPDTSTEIAAIPEALAASGYAELAASFPPWATTTESQAAVVAQLDDPLRSAGELLMLGRAVAVERLPQAVAAMVPAMERAGVCTTNDGTARLPGLALYRVPEAWLFAHVPQTSPTLYFGQDSVALASRLDTRRGCGLDLCAGPGVQSLVCAARGMQMVAVELNPVAAALCSTNVALNGRRSQVAVRCGDLYAEVAGESFDLICANPPLLPIPPGLPYPFVGDGGSDGMDVTWRILEGLNAHLSEPGHAQLIGMTLSDGFVPLVLPVLEEWCSREGFDLTWTTVNHLATDRESGWVQGVGATSAVHAGDGGAGAVRAAQAALAEGYARLGASHVCTYFARLARGTGRITYVDVSNPDGRGGLWCR